MTAAGCGPRLVLVLSLLLGALAMAQQRGNSLHNLEEGAAGGGGGKIHSKLSPGNFGGSEFDISSHLPEIALHGGFFVPVVEASGYVPTRQHTREVKEEERQTAAREVAANRFISEPAMCGSYTLAPGQAVGVATPYFPDNYTDNFQCTWSIKTDYTNLLLTCSSFGLGEGDYLSVQYGQEDTTVIFRGQRGPEGVVYPSNNLTLGFHSDCRTVGQGMDCYVDAIGSTPSWATSPVCGLPNRVKLNRITGGTETIEHQYPWQVLLYISWSDYRVTCSGSLIHVEWILTASHCLRRTKDGTLWTPSVEVHLGVVTREGGGEQVRKASKVILHPKLNFLYDVAILKLERPVAFSTTIRPICLPPRSLLDASPEGVKLEISGWGNDDTGDKSNVLNMIERTGMSSAKCKPYFPKYITGHHFCTYGNDRKHICIGDSGGSVMMEVEGRLVALGVTSFTATTFCDGTKPDGHSSVPHFLDWIEKETGIKLPA